MSIHQNSLFAWRQLKTTERERLILGALESSGRPMSDREMRDALRFQDMNAVRPRITELVKSGVLKECKDIIEAGRKVRTVWFANE